MKNVLLYAFKPKYLIMNFAVLIGTFLLGTAMHDILMAAEGSDDVFPMGTFMMLFGLLLLGFFANWQEEVVEFQLSLSMGCTRRKFFITYTLQYFVVMLVDWILAFLLEKFEMWRLGFFYGLPLFEDLGFLFPPVTFLLVPLFLTCLGLFIGGIGIRFGGNSRWIIIILWMALCIGLSKIENGSLMVKLFQMPTYAYGILVLIISLLLGAVAALMMRKQRVDI